jgi:hypothetical protein
MLDNLADFEPRRWFSKLRHKPETAEDEQGGLASLATAENGEGDEKPPVLERSELAPGWVVEEPILCIGGRNALAAAAADMLAGVLRKRGLGVKELGPEAISAVHISTLAGTEAKLVCLSYLGLGTGPAQIRYLMRRLRRILPQGTMILVCYWADEAESASAKELLLHAEADAYATSLLEAVELCVKAAKGDPKGEQEEPEDKAGKPAKPKRRGAPAPARVA